MDSLRQWLGGYDGEHIHSTAKAAFGNQGAALAPEDFASSDQGAALDPEDFAFSDQGVALDPEDFASSDQGAALDPPGNQFPGPLSAIFQLSFGEAEKWREQSPATGIAMDQQNLPANCRHPSPTHIAEGAKEYGYSFLPFFSDEGGKERHNWSPFFIAEGQNGMDIHSRLSFPTKEEKKDTTGLPFLLLKGKMVWIFIPCLSFPTKEEKKG